MLCRREKGGEPKPFDKDMQLKEKSVVAGIIFLNYQLMHFLSQESVFPRPPLDQTAASLTSRRR